MFVCFMQMDGGKALEATVLLDDSFEPWSSKRSSILGKYTTSEKLSITTVSWKLSYLCLNDDGEGGRMISVENSFKLFDMIKGNESDMSLILILSYRLKQMTYSYRCFTLF